jgi:hypothetical protein
MRIKTASGGVIANPIRWLAPLALVICALAQFPNSNLEIVPTLSELKPDQPSARPPRVFVPIQREFQWERILRSAAPEINFDHPTPQQIETIRKNPAVGGYTFCKIVPLLPEFKEGTYSLVAVAGIERIQPNAMKVCASFAEDNNPEFKPQSFWAEMVAQVPAKLRSGSSGFAIHSKGGGPAPVSSGSDRLQVTFSKQGNKTNLTLTYSHQGHTTQAVVDAQARQSLENWYLFREAGKLYAFTKWKGDESACATLYAIFEIGEELREVTLSGEECDV